MGNASPQTSWNNEHSQLIAVRFSDKSGIPQALEKMSADTGLKATEYARKVITESLEFDGYLHHEDKHPLDK